ncbi:unnamed protein product [Haemonchus placei]|uniref:ANF_receptor domain-containing protein n=1 Tax=Haemonchus placei TaxID=6290 RepID=A0A0N4W3N5_HAEPC|nr:unnamed protein product [Haemonchus placei]
MKNRSVDAVIGPPCPEAATMMAHLSTTYSVPFIGWGFVSSADFSNANKFPYATTISASSISLGYSILRLIELFEWDNLSILYTTNEVKYCDDIVDEVEGALSDVRVYNADVVYKKKIDKSRTNPFDEALNEVRQRSRSQFQERLGNDYYIGKH